jgi:hypothetical protein
LGNGPGSFGNGRDAGNAPCDTPGSTRSCCEGAGTQTCKADGEFASWGPCLDKAGKTPTCNGTGGGGTEDAGRPAQDSGGGTGQGGGGQEDSGGTGNGGGGTEPPCHCFPGTYINCDEDFCQGIICQAYAARRECQPDGTWGACHETQSGDFSPGMCLITFEGGCPPKLCLMTGNCQAQSSCDNPCRDLGFAY